MNDLRSGNDVVANDGFYSTLGDQIDLAPKYFAELSLKRGELNKANVRFFLEDHKKIDIAIGAKLRAERRTKDRQLLDAISPAQVADGGERDIDGELTHKLIVATRCAG